MPDGKPTAKKAQVSKDQAIVLALVSIAAVALIATLVVSKGLWSRASYLGSVADKKEAAVTQLEANKQALGELEKAYEEFAGRNPNMLGGNSTGLDARDGSNATLVLDALPSKYDFPALSSSVERLLTGYSITEFSGTDDSVAQAAAADVVGPVEMPFTLGVKTTYDGFKQMITSFNKSIRPFQVTKLELSGSNTSLEISVQAKSYYQPERGMQITEEQVP